MFGFRSPTRTRRAVLSRPPEQVVAILKSARSPTPDSRLEDVLREFRSYFLAIGRVRYPGLLEEVEDAVQNALMKLLDAERLAQLKEASRIEGWARRVFINAVLDVRRDGRDHHRGRVHRGTREDDPDADLLDYLPSDEETLEERAARNERWRIVEQCIERLRAKGREVAILKFFDGLSEKDIAQRTGLTRDAVAGQIKRLRELLRAVREEREGTST